MNTLIYKRTHTGDPNNLGVFGCHDCMGQVRNWSFDAVIGIGGKKPLRGCEQIANRINWVGINPTKTKSRKYTSPRVRFERFVLYEGKGRKLATIAPNLFKYMYKNNHDVRVVMSESLSPRIQQDVTKILALAKKHTNKGPVVLMTVPSSTKENCKSRVAKPRC